MTVVLDTNLLANDYAEAVFAVREQVRQAVESGIEFLLAKQASDPQRGFLDRLLGTSSRAGATSAGD